MVEDPKVKASAILKSVFGEDAEDAVSYDGGLSEGDAVSEEMMGTSTSVVEETYSAGEDDDNNSDKVRNSLPFAIAKDVTEEKKELPKPQFTLPAAKSD